MDKTRKYIPFWMTTLVAFLLMFSLLGAANACEIKVEYQDKTKEVYHVGDELILKVSVLLSHRNCTVGIDATTYKMENLEVIGATKWEEKSANYFERLLKVKILGSETGEAVLHALRECDKEGGYGLLKIKVAA